MIKTENLFKFVSIRVPQTGDAQTDETPQNPAIRFDNREWMNRIIGLVTGDISLDDARTRVSNDFMDSSAYVLRSAEWRPLLALKAQLQSILQQAENATGFRSSLVPLLAASIAPSLISLEDFVASAQFSQLKKSLWHSYYSNIALVNRRPQDRPLIEFWLRFWHFLERLVKGDDFTSLRQNFNTWRLEVPNQLIQPIRTDTSELADTADVSVAPAAVNNRIDEIQQSIAQLQITRTQIVKVFNAKLAKAAEKNAEKEANAIAASNSLNIDVVTPWRLTAEEIGHDAVKALDLLNISLHLHDATQINDLLERREAELESVLFKLKHKTRVAIVRGVAVRISR